MDKTKFQNPELINQVRQDILDYYSEDIIEYWGYGAYKDIPDWSGILKPNFNEFLHQVDEVASKLKQNPNLIGCIYINGDDYIACCVILNDQEDIDYFKNIKEHPGDSYEDYGFNNLYINFD